MKNRYEVGDRVKIPSRNIRTDEKNHRDYIHGIIAEYECRSSGGWYYKIYDIHTKVCMDVAEIFIYLE